MYEFISGDVMCEVSLSLWRSAALISEGVHGRGAGYKWELVVGPDTYEFTCHLNLPK